LNALGARDSDPAPGSASRTAADPPVTTRSFQHVIPALRLFGSPESLVQLGRKLERLDSRRALIVCGATLARDGSPLDLVRCPRRQRDPATGEHELASTHVVKRAQPRRPRVVGITLMPPR
jgi:hypothetical protein